MWGAMRVEGSVKEEMRMEGAVALHAFSPFEVGDGFYLLKKSQNTCDSGNTIYRPEQTIIATTLLSHRLPASRPRPFSNVILYR